MNEKLYLRLEIGSRTDVGRVRKNNEDACRALSSLNLFIISDGMGGQSHGEIASAIAVDTITAQCSRASASDEPSTADDDVQNRDYSEKTKRLANAVRLANRDIYQAALNTDIYLIEACAMAGVVVVVVTQILSDVFYTLLNPRITFGRAPRVKDTA